MEKSPNNLKKKLKAQWEIEQNEIKEKIDKTDHIANEKVNKNPGLNIRKSDSFAVWTSPSHKKSKAQPSQQCQYSRIPI
jgi:hypothetical protein